MFQKYFVNIHHILYRKRIEKTRNRPNKLKIYKLFWKPENDKKYAETDQKKGNRPVNWKFITFLKNWKQTKNLRKRIEKNKQEIDQQTLETNQKYAETGGNIKEQEGQQIENILLFLKPGNGPKICGNGNIGKSLKNIWPFKTGIRPKNRGNRSKKVGNPSKNKFKGISDYPFFKKTPQKILL